MQPDDLLTARAQAAAVAVLAQQMAFFVVNVGRAQQGLGAGGLAKQPAQVAQQPVREAGALGAGVGRRVALQI